MQTSNAQDVSRLAATRYLDAAHARRMQQLTQPREMPRPGTPDKPPAVTGAQRLETASTTAPAGAATGERVPVNGNANALERLLADWGKSGSPHDLDGDGTVGIKDMLALLARMAGPPGDETTHDEPASNQARLDALLADWGKTDSPHDLDGDGTVGIKDMLALLAEMPGPAGQDGVGPSDHQARLERLLAEWGQASATNDLDGDGTVGIKDMLALLAQMSGTPAADEGDEPTGPQARLAALLQQWGSEDSPYDLDGDGTVGIRDMLTLLARMNGQRGENTPGPAGAGPPAPPAGPTAHVHAAYQRAAAENIARSMMPHVGSTEPAELRAAIVDSSLPQLQKAAVLHRLSAWYRGHGLSLVG